MTLKRTILLTDDPAEQDKFGTHQRIATLVKNEILDAKEGRSIAIVGDWGSGKSTIIRLLQHDLEKSVAKDVHVFLYDAWSHQGDELRRAFLDDFIDSLFSKQLITKDEKDEALGHRLIKAHPYSD